MKSSGPQPDVRGADPGEVVKSILAVVLQQYDKEGAQDSGALTMAATTSTTGNDNGDNHRQLVNHIHYSPQIVSQGNQLVLKGYPAPGPQGGLAARYHSAPL